MRLVILQLIWLVGHITNLTQFFEVETSEFMIFKVTFEYFLATIQWTWMLLKLTLFLMINGLLIFQPKLFELGYFIWVQIIKRTILFVEQMNGLYLVFFGIRTCIKRAEKSSLL